MWALEKLKELFAYEKLLPNVLVTNRERVLMNVVEVAFPNSTHLLCMFHISKNVNMKCKEYVESHWHEHVIDMWNNIIYSNTETDFVVHLKHFEAVCVDTPKFVQYVHATQMTPYKERFATVWTNRVTHVGNTTTNRYINVNMNIVTLVIIK